MHQTIQFVLRHGYAVLFAWVFAEQVGLPIPAIPILLAAGALAGAHQLSFGLVLGLAVFASLISDLGWYQLGRRRGHSILNLLCRISLEPDSCVRRTENMFTQHGARALLFAKFIPGLSTVAPPLAGLIRMHPARFVVWDLAGAFVWAVTFAAAGYLFSAQLEMIAVYAAHLGSGLILFLAGALAAYIAWRYFERQRVMRSLRVARISPEELKRKLDGGEEIAVVDLRSSIEFETDAMKVPGAIHMLPGELEQRHEEIPRNRDVVLYCT